MTRSQTASLLMIRRCPACHGLVGPIVLLTMTGRGRFACRRCWATIAATPVSVVTAGLLGAAIGMAVLFLIWRGSGEFPRRGFALPLGLGVAASRLFPRLVIEDAPP